MNHDSLDEPGDRLDQAVTPVRVEVLDAEDGATTLCETVLSQGEWALAHGESILASSDASEDLLALRDCVAQALRRLSDIRALEHERDRLRAERDALAQELAEAHRQLAEVAELQRQLQGSLDQP